MYRYIVLMEDGRRKTCFSLRLVEKKRQLKSFLKSELKLGGDSAKIKTVSIEKIARIPQKQVTF